MFLDLSGNLCLIFTYHPELNVVHFNYKIILSHWHLWRVVCQKLHSVRVTSIGTSCTYQMDMRLPAIGSNSDAAVSFPFALRRR
jgi:hypothetical protein